MKSVSAVKAAYAAVLDQADEALGKGLGATVDRHEAAAKAMAEQHPFLPQARDNESQWARRSHLGRILEEAERLRAKFAKGRGVFGIGDGARQARLDELEAEADALLGMIAAYDDLVA